MRTVLRSLPTYSVADVFCPRSVADIATWEIRWEADGSGTVTSNPFVLLASMARAMSRSILNLGAAT